MSTADAESAAKLRPRGSNNLGTRQFNERVVLQAAAELKRTQGYLA